MQVEFRIVLVNMDFLMILFRLIAQFAIIVV